MIKRLNRSRHALLIEYGGGSSTKTRILLDHLPQLAGCVPMDISREHLWNTAAQLSDAAAYAGYPCPFAPTRRSSRPPEAIGPSAPASFISRLYYRQLLTGQAETFHRQIALSLRPRRRLIVGVGFKEISPDTGAGLQRPSGHHGEFNP